MIVSLMSERLDLKSNLIIEINSHVALFRDTLILVGQPRDCPELREKIRKLRRNCVETSKHMAHLIMTQSKCSNLNEHSNDNQTHLVLLSCLLQIFLRELYKSYRLIQVIPMDMSGYYENRAGPSNLGNVFGILLCKQITPDFNQEELNSIKKDSHEISVLISELQEHMPRHDAALLERNTAALEGHSWPSKRRRKSIYKHMSLFCCISRPNYL
uniref:Syntaxin N-terminal domain-containing protein n=1 Tax=Glossina brevipalpis TaxID=37001 RepID=A0A1A9WN30_9MUSC